MEVFTKEILIQKLKSISDKGWIPNARLGNSGGVGNTLEDLLGIEENNLPIPNAAEWELKTRRMGSTSLTTLFHVEPSPRAVKFVPQILLPLYGWSHKEAGKMYSGEELSFRQTIHGGEFSSRGFKIAIDRVNRKVLVSFDSTQVSKENLSWLKIVESKVGLGEVNPQPYWGFDDLEHKAGTKLLNAFYVFADVKTVKRKEYYQYNHALMLQEFDFNAFIDALERGKVLVDFDARTGHNHGTKFRIRQDYLPALYAKVTHIF